MFFLLQGGGAKFSLVPMSFCDNAVLFKQRTCLRFKSAENQPIGQCDAGSAFALILVVGKKLSNRCYLFVLFVLLCLLYYCLLCYDVMSSVF